MERLIWYKKGRKRSLGGKRKLAKHVITEVRDKSILRNTMKTGFREMETIDDFDKGDLHSMVGVKAILEWVEE